MADFDLLNKLSDPVFTLTLLEFLAALALWMHSLVKNRKGRKLWFALTLITFFIFITATVNPYIGK